MEFSSFEKPLRVETRLTKIDETLATSCKSKRIFVNGSRRGLLNWRFRLSIPESSEVFVPHENSDFLRKDNPDDWLVASRKGIENYLSLQLVAGVILIFSNLCKVTVDITVISSELLFEFSYFKSLLQSFGKGKFDGTSKKFGLSIVFTRFRK
jgi:hypothetical protein